MKRLLLTLLLCLAPAWAQAAKVAVIYESSSINTSTNSPFVVVPEMLRRNGVEFDAFNVGARTWNPTGTDADSTWFRKNYEAVIIPYLEGGVTLLGTWGTNFKSAGGSSSGINLSPTSGHWGIPVYVCLATNPSFMSGGFDETSSNWVLGIRPGGGAITNLPATSSRGTWGNKLKVRVRGDATDTLYTTAARKVCLYATWPGNGTVAALAWYDSTDASCTATDTVAVMWRFRPSSSKPGITYSVAALNRFGSMDGLLWILQNLYASTAIGNRARPVKIVVEPHNSYAGTTDATVAKANVQAIHDTLNAYGITPTLALAQLAAGSYASPHDADRRAELRRVVARGATWQPGSNNSGFTFAFYSASDTANVRQAFNSVMRTATDADSFALPPGRMASRYVPAAGDAGAWTAKVLYEAGIKTVVSTATTATSTGWQIVLGSSAADAPRRFTLPGGEHVNVVGTVGWTDGATFQAACSNCGAGTWDYVGAVVTSRIDNAAQTSKSLYWHMSTNTTGADPYWVFLASVIGRHFAYFNRVIQPAAP